MTWHPTRPSIQMAPFPIKRALSHQNIPDSYQRSLCPVKRAICSSKWALFAIKQPYILWKEPHFVWKQSYFLLKEHLMLNIFLCPFFFPPLGATYFFPHFQREVLLATHICISLLVIFMQRVLSSMETVLFCIKEHQLCFGLHQRINLFSPHKMRHVFF